MPSKWIEHIKAFAKTNGMAYKDALKDPKCKSSYQEAKGKGVSPVPAEEKKENIQMVVTEKKRRGRPPKYSTDEERKKAKSAKTMESNKRKKNKTVESESESEEEKEEELTEPSVKEEGKGFKKKVKHTQKSIIKDLVGKGILSAGYKTENPNGLGHIYPISHELVLEMIKKYI